MIDSHAHLQDDVFKEDIRDVLLRAKSAGVNGVVCASVDFSDSLACIKLAREFVEVFPCAGVAPYSNLSEVKATMQLIEDSPDIVAVGEIGLDYKLKRHPEQIEPFKKQIELAKELELPVVVHSRSAGRYCLEVLDSLKAEKVVMHSFDGALKYARLGFDRGYYFSIPLTVLKNEQKQKLAKEIPEELLLLETDSPVLNPAGGRNEPSNLIKGRDFIAELRDMAPAEIDKITESNARRIFGLNRL